MKIVAMANGGFAVPALRAIQKSNHELIAVVAMPDRVKGKRAQASRSPVRVAVENNEFPGVPFYDPENINASEGVELVRSLNADVIFICDYGRILSKELLEATRLGGVNLHGSLLPKYRGAAPINRAIQAGERTLGVSVIFIEPTVDSGPVVAVASYEPSLEDTAVEIEERLAAMGAPLVVNALDQIERGAVAPIPQDSAAVTKAPKLKKEEGKINWSSSGAEIIDAYRAFQPWPRVYSDWAKGDASDAAPTRLILGPFSSDNLEELAAVPDWEDKSCGEVVRVTKSSLWVRVGDGALKVCAAQPAGKKQLKIEDFLRGYQVRVGDRFE